MKIKPLILTVLGVAALLLSWAPQSNATRTRFIQVIKIVDDDNFDSRLHIGEIEAFEEGVEPDEGGDGEFDGKATSTNDIGDGELTTYGDGEILPDIGTTDALEHGGDNKDPNNVLETAGAVWSTADNLEDGAQYTLDLGAEYEVTTLRLWPRADDCCSNRWMNMVINLYGDDDGKPGSLNATETHTEDEGNIALEFEFEVDVNTLTEGLIGYWNFNDLGAGNTTETLDASDNSNVGTVNGDPEIVAGASETEGDFGIDFDGIDDSVTTEGFIMNDIDEFTMSGFVKFGEQPGNRVGLFGQNDAVEFGMINPTTMQHWSAQGGAFDVPFGPDIDEWTSIVLVNTPDERILYVNGEAVEFGGGTNPANSGFSFNIGGDGVYDDTGNYFTGQMDDVAVWGRALTAEEAAEIWKRKGVIVGPILDTDGDGMPDGYERKYGLDPFDPSDKDTDLDGDTLSNFTEYDVTGTLPNDKDTDKDSLEDNVETNTGTWVSAADSGTDPRKADSDKDGIADGAETNTGTFVDPTNTGTDPNVVDSDKDNFADMREIDAGTDPTDPLSFPMPPSGELLAYWNFDDASTEDTAVDTVSGIGGDVTAVYTEDGGGRTGAGGDYAMDFSEGGSVEVSEVVFMDAVGITDQFTVTLWQKNGDVTNSSSFWILADGFDRAAQAHIPWGSGTVYFDTAGGCCAAGSQRLQFDPPNSEGLEDFDFLDEEWHHYAFVKDQELKQVWIDGILAFETEGGDPMPESGYTLLNIGSAASGGNPVTAVIDEFAIFAVPLTEERIVGLANGDPIVGGGGPPFQITNLNIKGDGTVDVTWESKPGKSYAIEYAADIPDWIEGADGVESQGELTTFTDEDVSVGTKVRYYRIREES